MRGVAGVRHGRPGLGADRHRDALLADSVPKGNCSGGEIVTGGRVALLPESAVPDSTGPVEEQIRQATQPSIAKAA